MRKLLLFLMLLGGCCSSTVDEELLREIRAGLAKDVKPTLQKALDAAKDPNGKPLYIDAYKKAKVGVVDAMVKGIDRVYPPKGVEKPAEKPAEKGTK